MHVIDLFSKMMYLFKLKLLIPMIIDSKKIYNTHYWKLHQFIDVYNVCLYMSGCVTQKKSESANNIARRSMLGIHHYGNVGEHEKFP